ncbi:hypothetical protein NESM_000776600 [Novymonas esmeraldas]|uniref:Secreted protein n=1 Tax=Novymonas esmeraldas TaxID=1808958 RepID=A0AAW0EZE2_9TRYP
MFALAQFAATIAGSAVNATLERVLHALGTHPQNSLPLMSTVVSGSAPRLGGIEPDNLLLFSCNTLRPDSPLHASGRGPARSLPLREIFFRLAILPHVAGRTPFNLLLLSTSSCRTHIELHAAGSVPLSWLPLRSSV